MRKPHLNIHKACLNAQLANVMFGSYKLDVPLIGGGFGRIRGDKSARCHGSHKDAAVLAGCCVIT